MKSALAIASSKLGWRGKPVLRAWVRFLGSGHPSHLLAAIAVHSRELGEGADRRCSYRACGH